MHLAGVATSVCMGQIMCAWGFRTVHHTHVLNVPMQGLGNEAYVLRDSITVVLSEMVYAAAHTLSCLIDRDLNG